MASGPRAHGLDEEGGVSGLLGVRAVPVDEAEALEQVLPMEGGAGHRRPLAIRLKRNALRFCQCGTPADEAEEIPESKKAS